MSPLLVSTQQAHTHVSIAGQHPASTRPCLQCCAAPNTNVSISNRMSLDRMKIPRVVPENVFPYKCDMAAAERQQQQQQSWPQWSQKAVPGEEPLTLTKLRKRGRTRLGNYIIKPNGRDRRQASLSRTLALYVVPFRQVG